MTEKKEQKNITAVGYLNDTPEEPVIEKVTVEITKIDLSIPYNQRGDIYDIREKEIKEQLKAWAEKHGLDVYDYGECYVRWGYNLVAYNGTGQDDEGFYIKSSEYHDEAMELLARTDCRYMFMDGNRIEMPLWQDRDKATNREEAIKYLARAISKCFPSSRISNDTKAAMTAYAEKWGIPLDIALLEQAGNLFDSYDCASWNTSSKYC